MRKKILYIVLLTMMVLTACGKTEDVEEKEDKKQVKIEEEKKTVEEDVSSEEEILEAPATEDSQDIVDTTVVQEPSNDTTTEPNTRNTGATAKPSTGSTTKPSTGSTGSTNNSGNTGSTINNNTNSGTTTQPSTPVHEHKWTEVVEDEIHYYAWRTLCGKCNADMTDMTDEDLTYHSAIICNSRYSTKYIEVNFVTENIAKTPVVTGYKCECGAEK